MEYSTENGRAPETDAIHALTEDLSIIASEGNN